MIEMYNHTIQINQSTHCESVMCHQGRIERRGHRNTEILVVTKIRFYAHADVTSRIRGRVIQRTCLACRGVLQGKLADKSTIDMKLWILVVANVAYH